MLAALLFIAVGASAPTMPNFAAANAQMVQSYNEARAAMLMALTPAHRQFLGTLAGRLATSARPDYVVAARRLDSALSDNERNAIIRAAHIEHTHMRTIMMHARPPSMSNAIVLNVGSGPMSESGTAGAILVHIVMSAGPMTMNTMIVAN